MVHREQALRRPVVPFDPLKAASPAKMLQAMAQTSFQGRTLGMAFEVWQNALRNDACIFLGLAGAMVPAGMRRVISFLIEKRLVDVVVTTGANVFHDLYETLGYAHYVCSPFTDDKMLRRHRLDRIYDTLGDDEVYIDCDEFIARFAGSLEPRRYTTREFFHLLGRHIVPHEESPGILTTAYRAGVPIYCPAFGDSSYGIALAAHLPADHGLTFDIIQDVRELGEICVRAGTTGVVFLGGGTPKNFTQQAWVVAEMLAGKEMDDGHRFCIQITQDAPHWGGLSGCTFDESTSWGKIDFRAEKVICYCDATIALPILAAGLAEVKAWKLRRRIPKFGMKRRVEFALQTV
jgi:deoxyhypusine synthase